MARANFSSRATAITAVFSRSVILAVGQLRSGANVLATLPFFFYMSGFDKKKDAHSNAARNELGGIGFDFDTDSSR
jgi:hypothetical protein